MEYQNIEEWVNIIYPVDFKGKYQISSYGRFKRTGYFTKQGVWKPELILSLCTKNRYLKINIRRKGYSYNLSIHRLVCTHFNENPENKPQVNHKDTNKHNNHKNNLEWCTQPENIQHAQSAGILPYAKPKVKVYKTKEEKKKPQPKKVINISTGKIINTKILSDILGIKSRYVCRMLSEERKPNTSIWKYA